jgi:hypothetical protein
MSKEFTLLCCFHLPACHREKQNWCLSQDCQFLGSQRKPTLRPSSAAAFGSADQAAENSYATWRSDSIARPANQILAKDLSGPDEFAVVEATLVRRFPIASGKFASFRTRRPERRVGCRGWTRSSSFSRSLRALALQDSRLCSAPRAQIHEKALGFTGCDNQDTGFLGERRLPRLKKRLRFLAEVYSSIPIPEVFELPLQGSDQ